MRNRKYGYAIISALLNKSWLNSKHLPGLLSKFYYFFIAEFDARAHNLSIDPIITDEYLSSIVGIIASKVNLNAESTESLKVWAMQYASKTPVILAPIKESNSNIYMHVNSVMSQCGDNADFQSNFDKSMKDLDTFITGCFSIVFSKYIQSGPFFQAVQFMTEVSLEKFMNATLDEKHKGLIVDKDRQLLCITRKLKFIPYLHDYKEFDSLLYVIHPGPDKTWYVRGVSRVRDSYAVRRPIPQISKIEPRFPELHNQVEFVHHNGHMARVKSFQAALHFAFILVKL